MKKWEEAEQDASKAIQMDPKNAKVRIWILRIFLFKARLTHSSFLDEKSDKSAGKVVEMNPKMQTIIVQ